MDAIVTAFRPPHGMDTGDAPSSFEMGTDGGFYAGHTPTDAGAPRERGGKGTPGWLVMLGCMGLTTATVGGVLWWLVPPGDEPPAAVSVAAPELAPESPLDEDLRALARANAREQAQRLAWEQRHALLESLSTGPHAALVDRRLHLALDLLQAGQAEAPCEAFAEALDRVQESPDPYFVEALSSARAPRGTCADLDARREALHRGLVEPAADPVVEPEDPEPSASDRDHRRSSKRSRKPKRTDAASKDASKKDASQKDASQKDASKIGGKLHDELRPFGK